MPDTYLDSSIVGFNHQDALNARIDTYARLSPILNMQDNPAIGPGYADVLKGELGGAQSVTNPEFTEIDMRSALNSDDPIVRGAALQTIQDQINSTPQGRLGLGKTIESPKNEYAEKFLSKDFGYSAIRDNEDFYFQNEYMKDGWFKRNLIKNPMRFLGRTVGGAVLKFGEGLGYLGSMVGSIGADNYWASIADNQFSKWFEGLETGLKNQVIPVYKQAGFDEQGFFSKLNDWTFWNDSVADGVAFLGSMMIPMGAASKLGLLGKGASSFARANKALRGGLGFITGSETFGEAGMVAFNVATESAVEASDRFKSAKEELLEKRERGIIDISDQEIEEQAGQQAATTFKWNAAALMLSQAWEMKNIYKPLLGRGANASPMANKIVLNEAGRAGLKDYTNAFAKFLNKTRVGKDIRFYGGKALGSTMVEGFWEENIQTAIQRSAAGEYTRRGDDTSPLGVMEEAGSGFAGIMRQFGKQTVQALQGDDRETAESIGLGGIIGIIGGTAGSKFGKRINPETQKKGFFLGERRANEMVTNLRIAEINNAYNNRMSISDVRDEKGKVDVDKLRAKIANMESFNARQDVLDQLKDTKELAEEDFEVLNNKLLNDYTKSLSKVGKLEDAIARFEAMATAPITDGNTQSRQDAQKTAGYLREMSQLYDKISRKNIQNGVPKGVTPQELEIHNEARRDRAFDLMAERRALKPVLDSLGQDVQDNFKNILDYLQEQATTTDDLGETLAENKNVDYIRAQAKKEFYEEQAKTDVPQFMKDHFQAKAKEAENEMKKLDEFLGEENKPVFKDGKLVLSPEQENDPAAKFTKSLIEGYKNAYKNQSQVEFLQQRNEFLADAILDPNQGFDNWNQYLDKAKEFATRQAMTPTTEEAPEEKPTDEPLPETPLGEEPEFDFLKENLLRSLADRYDTWSNVRDGSDREQFEEQITSVVDRLRGVDKAKLTKDAIRAYLKNIKAYPKSGEELDFIVDMLYDELTQPEEPAEVKPEPNPNQTATPTDEVVPPEFTEDPSITDEKKASKEPFDEIDPTKPITWSTPLITSKRDTYPVDKNTEQLYDIPYDEMRKEVISMLMTDPDFADTFKLFIVKDQFAEIYASPANNENKDDAVVPSGQVIVLENTGGKRVQVKDVFPNKYKDMAEMPIVFSFNKDMFFNDLIDIRASIWATKNKLTPDAAVDFYNEEHKKSLTARDLVKNANDKVPIEIIDSTSGVMPMSTFAPVSERFGDNFTFSVQIQDTDRFSKGAVVVTVDNVKFAVGTQKLSTDANEMANVQKTLDKKYATKEDALQVRSQYLNRVFHTSDNQNFVVLDNKDGTFRIEFRKIPDKARMLPPEQKRKMLQPANEKVGDLRFNVDRKSLQNGLNRYNPETGAFINIASEEYQSWIKTKLGTYLKKTLDAKGNLYMKPVNPHFSFRITDERVEKPDVDTAQNKNFDKVRNRIEQLATEGKLTAEKIKEVGDGIISMRDSKQLTNKQVADLVSYLGKVQNLPPVSQAGTTTDEQNDIATTIAENEAAKPVSTENLDLLYNMGLLTKFEGKALTKGKKYVRIQVDQRGTPYSIEIVTGTGESYDYRFMSGFTGAGSTEASTVKFPTLIDSKGKEVRAVSPERLGRLYELPTIDMTDKKALAELFVSKTKRLLSEPSGSKIGKKNIQDDGFDFSYDLHFYNLDTTIGVIPSVTTQRVAEVEKILRAEYDRQLGLSTGPTRGEIKAQIQEGKFFTRSIDDAKKAKELMGEDYVVFAATQKTGNEQVSGYTVSKKETPKPQVSQEVFEERVAPYLVENEAFNTKLKKGYEYFYVLLGTGNQIVKVAGIPIEYEGFKFFIEGETGHYNIYEERTGVNIGTFFHTQKLAKEGLKPYLDTKDDWKAKIQTYKNLLTKLREEPDMNMPKKKVAPKEEALSPEQDIERRRQEKLAQIKRGAKNIKSTPSEAYKKLVDKVNKEFDEELDALETKEPTLPKVEPLKTPELTPTEEMEEDDLEAKAKALRGKMGNKEKQNLNAVVGNTPVLEKEYAIVISEGEFVMDKNTGLIKKTMKFGPTVKMMNVPENSPVLKSVLDQAYQSYPFTKFEDGTITGFFKTELEGTNGTFTAFGLPTKENNEVFIAPNGKPFIATDDQGLSVDPTEKIRALLTEQGKEQLDTFLNRNC